MAYYYYENMDSWIKPIVAAAGVRILWLAMKFNNTEHCTKVQSGSNISTGCAVLGVLFQFMTINRAKNYS